MGRQIPLVRAARDDARDPRPAGTRPRRAAAAEPAAVSDRHAVDLILDEARRRPGEITLVTLGPLTNLALAVLREPALPRLLKGYALMGGAFGVSGNTTPTTEWNIHCDPEAAKIVFRAWADGHRGGPVDPAAAGARSGRHRAGPHRARAHRPPRAAGRQHARTTRSPWRAARTRCAPQRSVASQPDRPLRRRRAALLLRVPPAVRRLLRRVHPRSAGRGGHPGSRVWSRPSALFVDVETRGELTTGMTVADRRRLTGRPPNLDVATSADVADVPRSPHRTCRRAGGGPGGRVTLGAEREPARLRAARMEWRKTQP